MIDTIVFDVGNVLVEWNYSDYLDGLGFSLETKAAVINAVFENPVWNKLDQGTVLLVGETVNFPRFKQRWLCE